MATAIMAWVVAIPLLGLATGLRSMTPIALVCWCAHLGYLPVQGTWAFWTAHTVSVVVFSLAALGEYVGDKLPRTPNRIAPGPLAARIVFGGLVGAIAATALKGAGLEGAFLGIVGVFLGAFGGFSIRREIVEHFGSRDWPVALVEDAITLACSAFALRVITG
jgi:uncharacterized membrane protein